MCNLFSNLFWPRPEWQKFIFENDINQEKIYNNLKQNILLHNKELQNEIKVLKSWFKSNTKYYQIYKKINY